MSAATSVNGHNGHATKPTFAVDENEQMVAAGDVDGLWRRLLESEPLMTSQGTLCQFLLRALDVASRRDPARIAAAYRRMIAFSDYLARRTQHQVIAAIAASDAKRRLDQQALSGEVVDKMLPLLKNLNRELMEMMESQARTARMWHLAGKSSAPGEPATSDPGDCVKDNPASSLPDPPAPTPAASAASGADPDEHGQHADTVAAAAVTGNGNGASRTTGHPSAGSDTTVDADRQAALPSNGRGRASTEPSVRPAAHRAESTSARHASEEEEPGEDELLILPSGWMGSGPPGYTEEGYRRECVHYTGESRSCPADFVTTSVDTVTSAMGTAVPTASH